MEPADLTLSAGPNDVSPEVRAALGSPIRYHYDPEFIERFRATEAKIARIFRTTRHEIILMQGEAVLGLEAAARCGREPRDGVPQPRIGRLRQGIRVLAGRDLGADLHEIEVGYDQAIDAAEVEAYLDAHPEVKMVSVVHSETPSGTLNPVRELGPICRRRGVVTIVDAVSSFGGIELRPEEWQLDLLVAGPQKCLGGPPGMSLMAVSEQAWARSSATLRRRVARSCRCSTGVSSGTGRAGSPSLPPSRTFTGSTRRPTQLLAEGLDAVQARHERMAIASRAGVRGMGLRPWPASDDIAAACVSAITVPDGLTDTDVRDHVRAHYGVQLSAGQGAGNIIRIGHMAGTARPMFVVAGLAALGRSLLDLGARVDVGAGLEAALASLADSRPGVDRAAVPPELVGAVS